MFKLEFSGLSFDNSNYINEKYQEGKPILISNYETTVSDTWNNEVYPVQTIFYTQYKLMFYCRNNEAVELEKVKYAPKITLYYLTEILNCKVINFEVNELLNEFKEVTISLIDLDSKRVENTILQKAAVDVLIYTSPEPVVSNFNLQLLPFDDYDLQINEASNFKNRITDYSKLTTIKRIRLYLTSANLAAFLLKLTRVSPIYSYLKLQNYSTQYRYFNFAKEKIGYDLHKIDIDLLTTNPTIQPTFNI